MGEVEWEREGGEVGERWTERGAERNPWGTEKVRGVQREREAGRQILRQRQTETDTEADRHRHREDCRENTKMIGYVNM